MASSPSLPDALGYDYVGRTRRLTVNLQFLLPFVLLYELCLLSTRSPVENAAAAWLRGLGRSLSPEAWLVFSLGVAALLMLLLAWRVREAESDPGVFGGMVLEGLVYGAFLGTLAHVLSTWLPMERSIWIPGEVARGSTLMGLRLSLQELGLAIGAGVFEELLFRGLLLGAVYLFLSRLVQLPKVVAGVIAIVIAAWVFSEYHHWGPGAAPLEPTVFAYRFHAGVILGTIFLTRGLGIAAFAHGFYDVLVMNTMP